MQYQYSLETERRIWTGEVAREVRDEAVKAIRAAKPVFGKKSTKR